MKLVVVGLMVLIAFFFGGDAVASIEEGEEFSLPQVFEYPAIKGRDPFSPLIREKKEEVKPPPKIKEEPVQVVAQSDYKIVGIVWDKGENVALIAKGEKSWVVKEGMEIDGLKVARIEGERGLVTLRGENKILQLSMLGDVG